jgi:hypothetical protein
LTGAGWVLIVACPLPSKIMPRLHVHVIGGVSLVLGSVLLVVTQLVLMPPMTSDAAEQLTVIARTSSWSGLQQASLAALPLLLVGVLCAAARVVDGGARAWGWLGAGLSIYGVTAIAVALCFFSGSAASTQSLVAENAPIDAALLASYQLFLPTALIAQSAGWLALGLGLALLGRGVEIARVSASWVAGTVSALGALGALLTLARHSVAGIGLAQAAVLGAALVLSAVLVVSPTARDA